MASPSAFKSLASEDRDCQGDTMDSLSKIRRRVKPTQGEMAEIKRILCRVMCSIHLKDEEEDEDVGDRDSHLLDTLVTLSHLVEATETFEPEPEPVPSLSTDEISRIVLDRPGYQFNVYPRQRVFATVEDHPEIVASDSGCHLVIRNVPFDYLEPQLLELLDQCGKIYELRIPIEPEIGMTKGQAYVTFHDPSQVLKAITKFHGLEVEPGQRLTVRQITPKTRLFIGNLPKCKQHVDLEKSFGVLTHGLSQVISFPAERRGQNNRGFCFIEYTTHEAAVAARKRLTSMKIFGCDLQVDWAWERPPVPSYGGAQYSA